MMREVIGAAVFMVASGLLWVVFTLSVVSYRRRQKSRLSLSEGWNWRTLREE